MTTFLEQARAHLDALAPHNRAHAQRYPGDSPARQPVHTVYGGAHLFRADTTARLGELAIACMKRCGRDAVEFANGVSFTTSEALADKVFERVCRKLEREPVEDFRIDFEDGFGARPDDEEDRVARAAGEETARAMAEGSAPPFLGIRIKSLGEEWKARSARTLALYLEALLARSGGKLPDNFVVTLPKITSSEQARTLVRLFELLEQRFQLPERSLRMELMIEVTQALLGPDGRSPLPGFLDACEGRCVAAHFGTYDFTASCGITASYQTMSHRLCDLAKGMMMLAYAGTGIFLSDGATNVMPIAFAREDEPTPEDERAARASVHAAWQLSHRHIRHSLEGGFYQGWDLHPAQLPVRFATCFGFFLESFDQAAERLSNFVDKAAQATLVGGVFDDAATGQGLLNYFLRALNSGALDSTDMARTGLTREELELRSFAKILESRRTRMAAAG